MRDLSFVVTIITVVLFIFANITHSEESSVIGHTQNGSSSTYLINPGDVISVHVWNEPSVSVPQVIVRPDGIISLPIIGEIKAGGNSINALSQTVAQALLNYLKDKPIVTISTLSLAGNVVYVLGKINRPGKYVMEGPTDVTQALAMAGGVTTFADANDIKILRRDATGVQKSLSFRYGSIANGKKLDTNIILQGSDVIIVP